MPRSLGSGEKRLLLAGVVGLVSISGLIVGNRALRQISEGLAVPSADRERFVKERTDEAELGRIRRKLEGPPKQCSLQLEELRDRYGLQTLGERCRFLSALDEFMVS